MKFIINFLLFLFISPNLFGQDIFDNWDTKENAAHLQFLSSDELMGRNTGEPGNDIAARYIATQYERFGIKPLEGLEGYFQNVPFAFVSPQDHTVTWNEVEYDQGESFLALSEGEYVGDMETVFANHAASEEDYADLDVEGRVVIALMGDGENNNPRSAFGMRRSKIELAKAQGALGLVELFSVQAPWNMMVNFMNRPRLQLMDNKDSEDRFFSGIINMDNEKIAEMTAGNSGKMSINYPGLKQKPMHSKNVIGVIEGTDADKKDDYILLSAHYDHVGTGQRGANPDTIFNGARDNGLGTVALLAAAKTLSENPPKRSVLLAAWTAEEKGLLGSRYFVDQAPLALNKIKFNLNTDGAGYDDTTAVSILGLHRVGAEEEMVKACDAFGLKVIADPAPEQNLFDRSDNVNFAAVGIPAPTFSPGTTGFTQEITKYYHQPGDQYDSINISYVDKFWKAFTLAAFYIGNKDENPMWIEGDKYEEAGKKLYQE